MSIDDNSELLQQLKSGFKHTINWNKFQSKVTTQARNQHFYYLIHPRLQRVNRFFVLQFENNAFRPIHTRYFVPTVELKDYMIKRCHD